VHEAEPYTRLADVYDELVVDPCYDRWAGYLHELWSSDHDPVQTVLDVCCGTGLMTAELTALGYRVVGVDRSPAMLARARQLLGPDAVLAQQTLPELTIGGVFDAAISTFDGLNYLSPGALASTFSALGRRLRPGGWLVFDLHTDAMMEFTGNHPVVEGKSAGRHFEISSVVDVSARTCNTRIVMTRKVDGDIFSEQHDQYFFTDAEVRDALAAAHFVLVAITDEYTHAPVGRSSLRATWAARRLAA
jgi:SAM-dependent methyltransferase